MYNRIPFTIATIVLKYLRGSLKKQYVKFGEKFKTLLKNIKEDLNKWRNLSYSWKR